MTLRFATVAVAAHLICSGCMTTEAGANAHGVSTASTATDLPAWPPAPAPARIRYVRSVGSAADWGIARGFFGRLADSFTGRHESQLVRPTGVAEHAGVLYVADPGAQSLFILDASRHKEIRVRRLGDTTLISPIAVAAGPDDSVFLADSFLKRVFAVGRDGKLLRVVVAEGLARPAAVAYDASRQRLYVADSMSHQVLVYSPEGRPLGAYGGNGLQEGRFNSPTHLGLLRDGRLLVTDALNFRVQILEPEGQYVAQFGKHGDGAGNFAAPKGVAADSQGRIYVADAMFDALQVFGDDGQLLLGLGQQGTEPGQFWLPNGLYVGPDDILYVADAYNRRIQVFQILSAPTGASSP